MRTIGARRLRDERGVTLIETMVALGLFALTAATMGDFLRQQIRTGSANANYSTAYALAAGEFEDLRALTYDDITSRSSTSSQNKVTFAVSTAVVADTPGPNMKQITVNVNWNEPGGPQNVTVQSIYTSIRR